MEACGGGVTRLDWNPGRLAPVRYLTEDPIEGNYTRPICSLHTLGFCVTGTYAHYTPTLLHDFPG